MSRPYVDVFFDLSDSRTLRRVPQDVRVVQAEYAHEAAVITYFHDKEFAALMHRGRPIKIVWGWAWATTQFVGYVHHTTLDSSIDGPDQGVRLMQVVCVGATDPLNATGFAQYRNVRTDAVVSQVVRTANLSVAVERSPTVWPLLQQQGESGWAFLVACARRVGWTLYPLGTDVRCHSRAIRYPDATTFRDFGVKMGVQHGSVYGFETVKAETLHGPVRKRQLVAHGIDSTGTLFTAATGTQTNLSGPRATSPARTEYTTDTARSVAESIAITAGEQEINRHYLTGKLILSGDPTVHAGGAVRVVSIDDDHDGFWYATRVEHVITLNDYLMHLQVGKDSLGDYAVAAGSRTVRVIPGDTSVRAPAPSIGAPAPAPLLDGGGTVLPLRGSVRQSYWRSTAPVERAVPPAGRPVRILANS